jgi:hypothetical protein
MRLLLRGHFACGHQTDKGDYEKDRRCHNTMRRSFVAVGRLRFRCLTDGSEQVAAQLMAIFNGLYGTALVLEEFGNVIARGGAGVVIARKARSSGGVFTKETDGF